MFHNSSWIRLRPNRPAQGEFDKAAASYRKIADAYEVALQRHKDAEIETEVAQARQRFDRTLQGVLASYPVIQSDGTWQAVQFDLAVPYATRLENHEQVVARYTDALSEIPEQDRTQLVLLGPDSPSRTPWAQINEDLKQASSAAQARKPAVASERYDQAESKLLAAAEAMFIDYRTLAVTYGQALGAQASPPSDEVRSTGAMLEEIRNLSARSGPDAVQQVAGVIESLDELAQPQTLQVPSAFPTITAALDRAQRGDVVLIAAGDYDERIVLTADHRGVNLRGAGQARTTITASAAGNASVLFTNGTSDNVIEGLTFEHKGTNEADNKVGAATFSDSIRVELRNCRFTGSPGDGALVLPGSRVTFVACQFDRNARHGLMLTDSSPSDANPDNASAVRLSTASHNGEAGVAVLGRSGARVIENRMQSNGSAGITVGELDASPTVQSNTSTDNRGPGLFVYGGSSGLYSQNILSGNDQSGLELRDFGGSPRFQNNTARDNRLSGFLVHEGAMPAVFMLNLAERNKGSGFLIRGEKTSVTLTESKALDNGRHGIHFEQAAGEIRSNTTARNKMQGILLNAASPTVVKNLAQANEDCGVGVIAGAAPTLTGNMLTQNAISGLWIAGAKGRVELRDNRVVDNRRYGILLTDGAAYQDGGNNTVEDHPQGNVHRRTTDDS